LEQTIGFFAVLLGAGNAAGGFAVTRRMLGMFQTSHPAVKVVHQKAHPKTHHPKKG
jgi:NAD(P) transhydrogenase subunit alpha